MVDERKAPMNDPKHPRFSEMPIPWPASELDHHEITDNERISLKPEATATIRKAIGRVTDTDFEVSGSTMHGIVDAVGNQIVELTIRLSKAGVTGDGLEFTAEEKRSSGAVTNISIGTVGNLGVLGNVSGSATVSVQRSQTFTTAQVGELGDLLAQIDKYRADLDLPESRLAELDTQVKTIRTKLDQTEPPAGIVRSGLRSLKAILEGATGNVVAQGVVALVDKFI